MKSVTVRDLSYDDLSNDKSRKSFISCLNELAPTDLSLEALLSIFFERQHEGFRTLVAVNGDEIIGTGSILIEPKYIHSGGRTAHIEDVAVRRDYQLTGIGSLIVQHLVDIAKAVACYKVVLDCNDKTAPFYEKLGFKHHGCYMRISL